MTRAAKLARTDLFSLEDYAQQRADFRARVIKHKQTRHVALGEHVTLQFEDALTIQYQIQEMLRIEKIFEADGIQEELDAYNPLIPDGSNLKATMLIEYEDPAERAVALRELVRIEDRVWVRVAGHDPVFAIADEDMDRSTEDKTAAVHFLRFELTPTAAADLKAGKALSMGIDLPAYPADPVILDAAVRASLAADLD
jgi:hypothetical protein